MFLGFGEIINTDPATAADVHRQKDQRKKVGKMRKDARKHFIIYAVFM